MEITEYEKIVLYVKERKYVDGESESNKRRLRFQSKSFEADNEGKLFYTADKDGENLRKTVITKERKNSAIILCHKGHLGRDKTYEKCNARFYWKGMKQDIADFIKKCPECQTHNKKTKTTVQEMIPVDIPLKVWGKVGIDLIGPFLSADRRNPLSKRGYRYVLTIMDYFTKWPEAYPLFKKNASEVAIKLHSTVCRFGVMEEIISDQGGEFNSKITKQLTDQFGIKHVTTSPYHPQANGMVERFNQTLKGMLNKMIDNKGEDWDLFVEEALFHYRTSKHHSTKYSPFYLMYFRQPVLPNETALTLQKSKGQDYSEELIDNAVKLVEKMKEQLTGKVSDNLQHAQKQQKQSYDRRHNVDEKTYDVGDKVLLKNFRRKAGLGTVQQTRYLGPLEIKKYCGKGNYIMIDTQKQKQYGPHNQKNLKMWHETDDDGDEDKDDDDDAVIAATDNDGDDDNVIAADTDGDHDVTTVDDDEGDYVIGAFAREDDDVMAADVDEGDDEEDVISADDDNGDGDDDDIFLTQSNVVEKQTEKISHESTAERSSKPKRERKRKRNSIYDYY